MLQIKSCYRFNPALLITIVMLSLVGCDKPETSTESAEPPRVPNPISVVFVEAGGVGDEIARRWEAETGAKVNCTEVSLADFADDDYAVLRKHDVVVSPTMLTGDLLENELITPLPGAVWSSEVLESRGLLRHCRTTLASFGQERFSIPVSNPHFMMLIRNELVETWGRPLPTTWRGMMALVDKATELENFEVNVSIPCAPGWAARSFIAIAAPEIRQRGNLNTLFNRRTMKPMLTTPPFVRGLERLKELAGENISLNPQTTVQQFQSGKSPIAIGWPSRSFEAQSTDESPIYDKTIVSRMPGTRQAYDVKTGKWKSLDVDSHTVEFTGFAATQISILRSASHPVDVYRFVEWLGSKRTTGSVLSVASFGSPTRAAHLGNINNWAGDVFDQRTLDQYSDLLSEAVESPIYLTFPRIPGSVQYWGALEEAVQSFLSGKTDALPALQQAEMRWEEITESFGRKNQLNMLRRDESL